MINESLLSKFPLLASMGLAAVLSAQTTASPQPSSEIAARISQFNPTINFNGNIVDILKGLENSKTYPPGHWNKSLSKWFIYDDQGKDAIGYGHDLTQREINSGKLITGVDYKNGITDSDAIALLKLDIAIREKTIKTFIPAYHTYPQAVKNAILVAFYRGDLLPKHQTTKLINKGNFKAAASEFLNNKNFNTANKGIQSRMLSIAKTLADYSN